MNNTNRLSNIIILYHIELYVKDHLINGFFLINDMQKPILNLYFSNEWFAGD